jgi:hypothetical protein
LAPTEQDGAVQTLLMDAGGLLYSGDSDAAVRVWGTKDVLYVSGQRARGRY